MEEVGEKTTLEKGEGLNRSLTVEEKQRILEIRRRKVLAERAAKKEKTEQSEKQKKTKRLVIAGFVISLIAIIMIILALILRWSWLPFISLGLSVIALIVFVPLIVKSVKSKKLPVKSGFFITGCILITASIVTSIILCILQLTQHQNKTLEEVDVNGMTVSEACDVARNKGWSVLEIIDENSGDNKSNCSDTKNRVTAYHYYNLQSSVNPGKIKLYFMSTPQNNSDNDTSTSEGDETPIPARQTESIDYNFRSTMNDYESFVDQYVTVIKAHKADPGNAELVEKYNAMTVDYNEWVDKINKIDKNNLSSSDLAYYNEVVDRVNKKIAEAN